VFNLYNDAGVIIATNGTGVFNNVPYGAYSVTATDGCTGQVFTRNFEVVPPIPTIGVITTGGFGCSGFNINIGAGSNQTTPLYCLYDSTGAVVACNSTGVFNGVAYGNYCIRMSNLCRDTVITRCIGSVGAPLPTVSAPAFSNQACSTFTAAVTGTNLNNPTVCIYDVNDSLLRCEPTGRFDNLPYGTYTIRLTNSAGCYDTTIVRRFTYNQPVPTMGTLGTDSKTCSGFRVFMNAGTNLTSPTYYIYNSANNEVANNTTGIFTLPYGSYQMRVVNSCYDTTMVANFSEAQTPNSLNVTSTPSCVMGRTNISVTFLTGTASFSVAIFDPWNNLVGSTHGPAATHTVNNLAGLGGGLQYRVVTNDACGNLRQVFVTPNSSSITKNVITNSRCPSGLWQNGSGDIVVTATSSFGAVTPRIIRRDATAVTINYSNNAGSTYTFNNMEPATYIIEYTVPSCSNRVYDTFQLAPYAYPELQQSAAYQCDNNSFSVGAAVTGGVGPFNYEIIGSYPSSPSIITPSQSNPVFAINNGVNYSLIRLRSVDACGNATLNDVSILPLANTIIQQAANCYYNSIVLNVDTIPNATYQWYKMNGPGDSTSLGSGTAYNIPYLTPSDTGMYVAKASVNSGCLTQLSYFNVTDYCGAILSSKITLNGKKINGLNQLSWAADNEEETKEYVIERSTGTTGIYQAIASVKAKKAGKSMYYFTDNQTHDQYALYRVKIVYHTDKSYHSNTVTFKPASSTGVAIFPNPVADQLNISVSNKEAQTFRVSILTVTGQVISETTHQNVLNTTIRYLRPGTVKPGVYMVKINNLKTGEIITSKVMFK
ncbi:MAG: T9SS type A sorting domain-containing protein, partial [Flavitalea sp.]